MQNGFICLTKTPHLSVLEFIHELNETTNILSYVVVDDNTYIAPQKYKYFILQLDDDICYNSGFKNVNFVIKKKITSWDKVLYLLCRTLKNIDFCWIVEDDVFIPSIESVVNMTNKYLDYDLVTSSDEPNTSENRKIWHWKHMPTYMNRNSKTISVDSSIDESYSWHKSMSCAIGISRRLLYIINLHCLAYKQLMFLEFLFNTLCHQANLFIKIAPELSTIIWRGKWKIEDFINNKNNWFHPVKNIEEYKEYRELINYK